MDFVTHFPWTSRGHDAMWVIVHRLINSIHFFGYEDDLHSGGILQVIHTRDCPVTWSSSLYSIIEGSWVYNSFLRELPTNHGDTVNDEHRFASPNGWSIIGDHLDVRGHVESMRPGS